MSLSRVVSSLFVALGITVVMAPSQAWACTTYTLPAAFAINQSTGTPVTIRVTWQNGSDFEGNLKWGVPGDGDNGIIREGEFDGKHITFTANWDRSALARYEGTVNSKGKLVGSAVWGTNSHASFKSIQSMTCKN